MLKTNTSHRNKTNMKNKRLCRLSLYKIAALDLGDDIVCGILYLSKTTM